jgi:hypothetical protein
MKYLYDISLKVSIFEKCHEKIIIGRNTISSSTGWGIPKL